MTLHRQGKAPYRVLFVCTGNSARSVLAECLLNRLGAGAFVASSAGSNPVGTVNPHALALLTDLGYETENLASKSWDVFADPDENAFDFIFTVCDSAAAETCPVWPGHPTTAHWGLPDPAAVEGSDSDKRAAFRSAYDLLSRRIEAFVALPVEELAGDELLQKLAHIGDMSTDLTNC